MLLVRNRCYQRYVKVVINIVFTFTYSVLPLFQSITTPPFFIHLKIYNAPMQGSKHD